MRLRSIVLSTLVACGSVGLAHADEGKSFKQEAKDAGHAVGDAFKEAGHETKVVAKKVGKSVQKAAVTTGHAVRDGAHDLKQEIKGEGQKSAAETKPGPHR